MKLSSYLGMRLMCTIAYQAINKEFYDFIRYSFLPSLPPSLPDQHAPVQPDPSRSTQNTGRLPMAIRCTAGSLPRENCPSTETSHLPRCHHNRVSAFPFKNSFTHGKYMYTYMYATWLHLVHEIAVPMSRSPQHSWWDLVLAEIHPA